MKEAIRDELLRGQTATSQKVYAAVPVNDSWSTEQVRSEVHRLGQAARMDHVVLHACLGALTDAKLVKQTSRGYWRRTPITVRGAASNLPEIEYANKDTTMAQENTETQDVGMVKRLKHLIENLREQAELSRNIADELELMSMELKDREAADEKLHQLRNLLKTI